MTNISRRQFLKTGLSILAASHLISCVTSSTKTAPLEPRLTARPFNPRNTAIKGLTNPILSNGRGVILYIPESYSHEIAMPLLIALHGSGEDSSTWKSYHARAEERGFILLAPDSRSTTWDLINGSYGADLIFLDEALKYVFERCNIDNTHIAFCGFSDGASYVLSLGISNGDLFTHLIGYSPGYLAGKEPVIGKPEIYISHGTEDNIFPVRITRNNIVPALVKSGYDVAYYEFEGGHEVPAAVSEAALDWFLRKN